MDPAERMRALLRYANFTHVAEGLTAAGYPVSGPTVSRWAKGRNVTPLAVRHVEDLLADTQNSAPAWAEALADKAAEKVISAVTSPAQTRQIEILIDRLERLSQLPGAESDDQNDGSDPAGSTPPEQAVG